jgi:hypothetical protein
MGVSQLRPIPCPPAGLVSGFIKMRDRDVSYAPTAEGADGDTASSHQLRIHMLDDAAWALHKTHRQDTWVGDCSARLAHTTNKDLPIKPNTRMKIKLPVNPQTSTEYVYAVLSDCSLVAGSGRPLPPILQYQFEFRNGDSHFPANQISLLYVYALVAIGLIGLLGTPHVLYLRVRATLFLLLV